MKSDPKNTSAIASSGLSFIAQLAQESSLVSFQNLNSSRVCESSADNFNLAAGNRTQVTKWIQTIFTWLYIRMYKHKLSVFWIHPAGLSTLFLCAAKGDIEGKGGCCALNSLTFAPLRCRLRFRLSLSRDRHAVLLRALRAGSHAFFQLRKQNKRRAKKKKKKNQQKRQRNRNNTKLKYTQKKYINSCLCMLRVYRV